MRENSKDISNEYKHLLFSAGPRMEENPPNPQTLKPAKFHVVVIHLPRPCSYNFTALVLNDFLNTPFSSCYVSLT